MTYKKIPIRLSPDFSAETLQLTRGWQDIFKVIKEKTLQPRLLYPARISFRFDGEFKSFTDKQRGFTGGSVVKNLPVKAGNRRVMGSIPGSGRSHGGGNGNPLQYSCLENPISRGARWATVRGVAKSQT